jgi:competence protein ComEC
MQTLLFIKSKKEWVLFLSALFIIFIINLLWQFNQYKNLITNEIYTTNVKIINIYHKNSFDVLKLSNNNILFFTSSTKDKFSKNDYINITILTKDINFLSYLKGFYVKSFNSYKIDSPNNFFIKIKDYINSQHINNDISSIFKAIFLAIPLDKDLQNTISTFGIAHLIAISGFHLGVLSFMLYFIFNIFYTPIHKKYLPFRNKKYDLLISISFILFGYLLFLSNQPSLLRAFIMYIFAILTIRSNIKILSFSTLLICILIIISLFPKLIFSLSLWFSLSGVFFIFLFLKYFKHLNKFILFIFLNIWLYLAINPISHYFFDTTSILQLISPLLTIAFSFFYPIELLLHIFNIGDLLDGYILMLLNIKTTTLHINTNIYFLLIYISLSFYSIKSKNAFILLNLMLILFNIYLYKSFISV